MNERKKSTIRELPMQEIEQVRGIAELRPVVGMRPTVVVLLNPLLVERLERVDDVGQLEFRADDLEEELLLDFVLQDVGPAALGAAHVAEHAPQLARVEVFQRHKSRDVVVNKAFLIDAQNLD